MNVDIVTTKSSKVKMCKWIYESKMGVVTSITVAMARVKVCLVRMSGSAAKMNTTS